MPRGEPRRDRPQCSRRARRAAAAAGALAAAGLSAAALAAAAANTTIGSAANATLGERVAVNAQGRTLYELSPETTRHLLCASSECLGLWPPAIVRRGGRPKAGVGLHGHLGMLRRGDGLIQVTLDGHPLYRYAGDSAKGQANGHGIRSFGGTWHAAALGAAPASTPTAPATSPGTGSTPPTSPGYY